MQRLDRILAVIDPTVDAHAAATKAARLAARTGASLELFVCDVDPLLLDDQLCDAPSLHRLRAEFLAERTASIEAIADELRQQEGVDATTHVHWDNPLHAGILRRIAEFEPDLVCKDTHYHSALRRALFTNTDWQLIRGCPVPLLLSRTPAWSPQPRILAALDPGHHGDKPAALDHDIVDTAQFMARQLDGSVEAVHLFFPAALVAATSGMAGVSLALDVDGVSLLEAERDRLARCMQEIAQAHGLDPAAVQVLQGAAAERLPHLAVERHIDLLVMGAIARGRLRELFIGSTAERVLDRLPCDVLVVRPPDFGRQLPF